MGVRRAAGSGLAAAAAACLVGVGLGVASAETPTAADLAAAIRVPPAALAQLVPVHVPSVPPSHASASGSGGSPALAGCTAAASARSAPIEAARIAGRLRHLREKDRERTAGEDVFMEKMMVHRTQPAAKRHASRPTVAEANRKNAHPSQVFY